VGARYSFSTSPLSPFVLFGYSKNTQTTQHGVARGDSQFLDLQLLELVEMLGL
jgi:hypothetical protein